MEVLLTSDAAVKLDLQSIKSHDSSFRAGHWKGTLSAEVQQKDALILHNHFCSLLLLKHPAIPELFVDNGYILCNIPASVARKE